MNQTYKLIHTLSLFYVYLYSVHTHPHTLAQYQKNLKICTPVGLARCSEAQSKFSAHFLTQQRPWDFFYFAFTLWTILACFYTWLVVCAWAKSRWNTSLCDYLECGVQPSWSRVLSFLKTDCAWFCDCMGLWWNKSVCCWFRSKLDLLSDEHLVYIIQHIWGCHRRMCACSCVWERVCAWTLLCSW